MSAEPEIVRLEYPVPEDRPRTPKWKRSALIIPERGQCFIPAAVFANEDHAYLMCIYDGAPTLTFRGHVYVLTSWLAKEAPEFANDLDRVAGIMLAHAAEGGDE